MHSTLLPSLRRIAGLTCHFNMVRVLVRKVAASIRGDVSASDTLDLHSMKAISITNRELPYGIKVDDISWVQQNILRREDVRDSRDEELIADILAYMALDNKPTTSSEILDAYFGLSTQDGPSRPFNEIETAVQKIGPETLAAQYIRVHEVMVSVLSQSGKAFNKLMFTGAGVRVPRYFQAVFLAFFQLIIKENLDVTDRKQVVTLLDGIGDKFMDVGGGGGRWSGAERQKNANAVAGVIRPGFAKRAHEDPATYSWITQFENILMQSFTEQNLYDFKQGLHRLDEQGALDEELIHKIVKTLTAIANHGPGTTGYVIVGVAENQQTSHRVEQIYGIKAHKYNRFFVTGIEHEATKYHKSLDSYFQLVLQKIAAEPVSAVAKDYISRNVRLIQYFDKAVLVLKVEAGNEPYSYDNKYFVRRGPNVDEVPFADYGDLFRRF